jgi:hypothetical protein
MYIDNLNILADAVELPENNDVRQEHFATYHLTLLQLFDCCWITSVYRNCF